MSCDYSPSELKQRRAAEAAALAALQRGATPLELIDTMRGFLERFAAADESIDDLDEDEAEAIAESARRYERAWLRRNLVSTRREYAAALFILIGHLCRNPPPQGAHLALSVLGEAEGADGDARSWYELMAGDLLIGIGRVASGAEDPTVVAVECASELVYHVQIKLRLRCARAFVEALDAVRRSEAA
jgi:hypothetical protein